MEIKKALAKSIGTNLITHNKNVGIASRYIAEQYLHITDPEILKIVEVSGTVHDIAKITEGHNEVRTIKLYAKEHLESEELLNALLKK